MQAWPLHELFQFMFGCKVLFGSLDGIVRTPTEKDIKENIKNLASGIYHEVCHRYVFCNGIDEEVSGLKEAYKTAFFILQEWVYLREHQYVPAKKDLIGCLQNQDRDVLDICIHWDSLEADRKRRPEYYFSLIISWSSMMLQKG